MIFNPRPMKALCVFLIVCAFTFAILALLGGVGQPGLREIPWLYSQTFSSSFTGGSLNNIASPNQAANVPVAAWWMGLWNYCRQDMLFGGIFCNSLTQAVGNGFLFGGQNSQFISIWVTGRDGITPSMVASLPYLQIVALAFMTVSIIVVIFFSPILAFSTILLSLAMQVCAFAVAAYFTSRTWARAEIALNSFNSLPNSLAQNTTFSYGGAYYFSIVAFVFLILAIIPIALIVFKGPQSQDKSLVNAFIMTPSSSPTPPGTRVNQSLHSFNNAGAAAGPYPDSRTPSPPAAGQYYQRQSTVQQQQQYPPDQHYYDPQQQASSQQYYGHQPLSYYDPNQSMRSQQQHHQQPPSQHQPSQPPVSRQTTFTMNTAATPMHSTSRFGPPSEYDYDRDYDRRSTDDADPAPAPVSRDPSPSRRQSHVTYHSQSHRDVSPSRGSQSYVAREPYRHLDRVETGAGSFVEECISQIESKGRSNTVQSQSQSQSQQRRPSNTNTVRPVTTTSTTTTGNRKTVDSQTGY